MASHSKSGTCNSILAGLFVGIQPPTTRMALVVMRGLMKSGLVEPTKVRGVWSLTDAGRANVQARSDRLTAQYAARYPTARGAE